LAAAGIGELGVLDYDQVEESNLQRQVIHSESTVGLSKVESARQSLSKLNSKCLLRTFDVLLSSENALEIIRGFDLIIDATDNVATRYLLNDACVLLDKPLVSGSALKFEGQVGGFLIGLSL
jgi:adenylyltransferase/sulfurtransferase